MNAYAQDQTADEQVYDLHDVRFRIDPGKKKHGEIDKISEYDGYSDLKNVLKLKIFPQMISCSMIRKILKKIVKFPSVNGKLRLNT